MKPSRHRNTIARRSRPSWTGESREVVELGIDGRLLAGLAGLTVLATGIGFVVAAGLDRPDFGRTVAVAAPSPSLSPEALDPETTPPVAGKA